MMLIPVVYLDGRQDMVKPFLLDRLIDEEKILRFKRSSGWAVIGHDPIRRRERQARTWVPERRALYELGGEEVSAVELC